MSAEHELTPREAYARQVAEAGDGPRAPRLNQAPRCPSCGVHDAEGHEPGDAFCLSMQDERRWKARG